MTALVAGLDQGTSSTRCVLVDDSLAERGSFSVPVACSFPAPGLVEQDPEAIATSATQAIAGALAAAGATAADVVALGIANQTETFIVWNRTTGAPVHPAIVWQDRRTDAECATLASHADFVGERTGLELDATFPATKLRWLLDRLAAGGDGAGHGAARDLAAPQDLAAGRDLAYGDVACWLLHRLAGVHMTDAGNAARSLLFPLAGDDWDDALLSLFGIPRAMLPRVVASDGIDATVEGIPVRAAAGDQQASLFGLRCWERGSAKVTLGTGAFVLAQAGSEPPSPPAGILASRAWTIQGTPSYALEGFIPTAGAALDWFARIGALPAGPELDALLREPGEDDGVVCVPALQGFGSPAWDASARGTISGLSLATTRADLARAVVDGILHQVADAIDAIGDLETLRIDGGISRSNWVVQRLADLADVRVERTARADSTALGAATMAGLAAGVWPDRDAIPEIPLDHTAEPRLPPQARRTARDRWAAAARAAMR